MIIDLPKTLTVRRNEKMLIHDVFNELRTGLINIKILWCFRNTGLLDKLGYASKNG